MTISEGVAWLLVAVLGLVVWDQHRVIWRLLETISRAVDVMEDTRIQVTRVADRLDERGVTVIQIEDVCHV